MAIITTRVLRRSLGRILRHAEQGWTFVITRHGTPIAQLGPITAESARYRPARRPAEFSVGDLVYGEVRTETALTADRGNR